MLALRLATRLGYEYGSDAGLWLSTATKADLVDNCGFAESDGRWACWLGSTPHPDIPRPMENLLLSGRLKLAEVARR